MVLGIGVYSPALFAQGPPGTNLRVMPRVVHSVSRGDTSTLSYVVANSPGSEEELFTFTVEAPPTGLEVMTPDPVDSWDVTSSYRGLSVASWTMLGVHLSPGAESDTLSYRAIGLPGIVKYWAQGWFPVPEYEVVTEPPPEEPGRFSNYIQGRTVGLEPLPEDRTGAGLLVRVQALLGRTCNDLAWITNRGTCRSLKAKLDAASRSLERGRTDAARGQLQAFLNELDAQRGQRVNENAYWLLRTNGEFLLERLLASAQEGRSRSESRVTLREVAGAQLPPSDSIDLWTALVQSGSLEERIRAVGKLKNTPVSDLPGNTQDALVEELDRFNRQRLGGQGPAVGSTLEADVVAEYYISLASMVAGIDDPQAWQALSAAVGVSRGIQRRVARLGEGAVPDLIEMIEGGLDPGPALTTLGLVWFWADSTGASLSSSARASIVDQLISGMQAEQMGHRLGAAAALQFIRDPTFLPLAEHFHRTAESQGDIPVARTLELYALPDLASEAEDRGHLDLLDALRRVAGAICTPGASAGRRGFCESTVNRIRTAIGHLEEGRTGPARNVLESLASSADRVLQDGVITEAEHALIAGGARQILERLEAGG